MPILMQINNDVVQNRVALGADPLAIGRAPDNDLQLEDKAVSAHHARLERVTGSQDSPEEQYRLVDLNSTNGSFINEKPCDRQTLVHNDTIRFGFVTFRFVDENQASMEETARVRKSWIPGVFITRE